MSVTAAGYRFEGSAHHLDHHLFWHPHHRPSVQADRWVATPALEHVWEANAGSVSEKVPPEHKTAVEREIAAKNEKMGQSNLTSSA